MTAPAGEGRACRACGAPIGESDVYYRFAIAVEAELDVIGAGGPAAADPHRVLADMEAEGDWERYEGEVHWEASGMLCAGCRRRLVELLTPPPSDPH